VIAGASLGAYNDGSMIDAFPVSRRGEPVGQVTSACHSPRLCKNIGYAMVPVELAELGTELAVEVDGDRRDAVVVKMPLASHQRRHSRPARVRATRFLMDRGRSPRRGDQPVREGPLHGVGVRMGRPHRQAVEHG
jgi:hypothetical protein